MAYLTLGGNTLLNPDGGGLLRQFTDCYISLSDLRLFGCDSVVRHTQRQDIGYPNYSTPHEFRLNTFYHYSGASRWSFGLFVVDDETLEEIGTGAMELVMNTGHGDEEEGVDTSLFTGGINAFGTPDEDSEFLISVKPLAARRISRSNIKDAWLLPVVDDRYFWQNRNVRVTNADTWADVYAALDIELDEEVDAAYLLPNRHRIENVDHNKGALTDAVLWSTGMWYEPRLGKAFEWRHAETLNRCQSELFAGDAEVRTEAEALGVVVAGGVNLFTGTPGVTVRFNGYKPCHDIKDVSVYSVQVGQGEIGAAPGGAINGEDGAAAGGTEERVFYSTALADFSDDEADPANKDDLDALAEKIGADYMLATQAVFDITFAGVRSWYLSGNTDVVIYEFGGDRATGKLSCQTRVQSLPYNFGVDLLLHEHEDVDDEMASTCSHLLGKTDAAHDKGASGTVSIYSGDTGGETDTGRNVTAYNRFADVGSGKWVIVACVDGGYELISAECG